MTLLPADFQPGENDVICGRGKKCYGHCGNERFRVHVVSMLDEYASAKSKLDKSSVLAKVVAQIRAKSPSGGFVKQDEQERWFEVGDFLAKEKTSQAFRDALHERYKSSNVSKKKRRQEEQTRGSDRLVRGVTRAYSDGPGIEWLALSSDASLAAARTGALDIFHDSNLDAFARLNRLGDIRSSRFRPHAPARSHSALGISTSRDVFSDPFGQSDSFVTGSIQNASFLPDTTFSNNNLPLQGFSNRLALSEPASPILNRGGSQEPLDAYRMKDRVDGIESTPKRSTSFDQISMGEILHHSMPDLSNSDWDPFSFRRERHNSAPDLNYTGEEEEDDDDDDSLGDVELDPIPMDEFTPRPSAKKKVGMEHFKRPISMTLSPTSPSVPVSADLLASLEKLNGSAITDSNPFEPLPLTSEEDFDRMVNGEQTNNLWPPSAFGKSR